MGEIYHYGEIYDELKGRAVGVTGKLDFEHYPPSDNLPRLAATIEHFGLENETVQIHPIASVP